MQLYHNESNDPSGKRPITHVRLNLTADELHYIVTAISRYGLMPSESEQILRLTHETMNHLQILEINHVT